jgi:hypothetical protein
VLVLFSDCADFLKWARGRWQWTQNNLNEAFGDNALELEQTYKWFKKYSVDFSPKAN